jgi:hypothetical protein
MASGAAPRSTLDDLLRDRAILEGLVGDDARPCLDEVRQRLFGPGGRDDQACVRLMLSGRSNDGVTVHVWHLQVGHDGVEGLAGQSVHRIGTTREGRDLVSVTGEKLRHPPHGGGVIVHNEEARHFVNPSQGGCQRSASTNLPYVFRHLYARRIGVRAVLALSREKCGSATGPLRQAKRFRRTTTVPKAWLGSRIAARPCALVPRVAL